MILSETLFRHEVGTFLSPRVLTMMTKTRTSLVCICVDNRIPNGSLMVLFVFHRPPALQIVAGTLSSISRLYDTSGFRRAGSM